MCSEKKCVDCHFFVREARSIPPPIALAISLENREKTRKKDFSWHTDHWTILCAYGVWDQGRDFEISKRYKILVETDRRNFCFFWKFRPGMELPSAKILQEREAAQREAKFDRRLTTIGLWIAALALVINIIIQLLDK